MRGILPRASCTCKNNSFNPRSSDHPPKLVNPDPVSQQQYTKSDEAHAEIERLAKQENTKCVRLCSKRKYVSVAYLYGRGVQTGPCRRRCVDSMNRRAARPFHRSRSTEPTFPDIEQRHCQDYEGQMKSGFCDLFPGCSIESSRQPRSGQVDQDVSCRNGTPLAEC